MTIFLFFEFIGSYYDSVTLFVEFQVGHQILVIFLHRFFGTYLQAKHLNPITHEVFELFSRIIFVSLILKFFLKIRTSV